MKWIGEVRGNDCMTLFEEVTRTDIICPPPICLTCSGQLKNQTYYIKFETPSEDRVRNFLLTLLPNPFFMFKDHLYVVQGRCPDCLGFSDAWGGKKSNPPTACTDQERNTYLAAFSRGLRNKALSAPKDEKDKELEKIKRTVGLL